MSKSECKSVESFLSAYLNDELDKARKVAVEAHVTACDACRTKLDEQRNTLDAVCSALEAVPVPVELSNHRWAFLRTAQPKRAWGMIWYSPRFSAVMLTAACSIAFVLGASLISIRSIIYKQPNYHYVRIKPSESIAPKLTSSVKISSDMNSVKSVESTVYDVSSPAELASSNLEIPVSDAVIVNLNMNQNLVLSRAQVEELRKLGINPEKVEEIDPKGKILVAGKQYAIEVDKIRSLADVLSTNVETFNASAAPYKIAE